MIRRRCRSTAACHLGPGWRDQGRSRRWNWGSPTAASASTGWPSARHARQHLQSIIDVKPQIDKLVG